jgi:RNA-directed DNA polymerase
MRMLGIPTVFDRFIQQALLQILSPLFDPTFSDASYGFRPGRSTHQAVRRAREHIAAGSRWVVDVDLEKLFDRVNPDVPMAPRGSPGEGHTSASADSPLSPGGDDGGGAALATAQ